MFQVEHISHILPRRLTIVTSVTLHPTCAYTTMDLGHLAAGG